MIISYHGCRQADIASLVAGHIDVSQGGGELGRGFYTTLSLNTARAWAWHKHQSRTVLEIAIADQDFEDLDPLILSREQAYYYRKVIKTLGQTRSYWFHRNLVWAPIVGDRMIKGEEQFKWESKMAERLINSTTVTRRSV